ncbi:MAG: primosomal protein N' [Proteobacteria bacterium]|nr:primosomal protein N' [Pseudomonadota bacterium]
MSTPDVIVQVALDVPLRRLFDYLPPLDQPTPLLRGMRVKVPFGRQTLVGIILGQKDHSELPKDKLKPISEVCDLEPIFPSSLCDFIEKTAQYYHHPVGEVAFSGAPLAIRLGKTKKTTNSKALLAPPSPSIEIKANSAQQKAIEAILETQSTFAPFLLEGITGSGKTEVYLQVVDALLKRDQQALILVPEISLTPQTYERFNARFGAKVALFHSRMTPKERYDVWMQIRHQQVSVVIGTRSAIFLPFMQLGIIIIDEEHDPSFKQQEGFRYSARDIGVLRAKMASCPIVLGSATPSFETLVNAQTGKYQHLTLPMRATSASLPKVTMLDVRHNKLEAGLSSALLSRIEKSLQQNQQVLLFINRRGFAPSFMCYDCGWLAKCTRCDARLTYHHKKQLLICHHCLQQRKMMTSCPDCEHKELHPVGQGTEKLESFLKEYFPTLNIARIDSDVTSKKGELESLLQKAQNNEAPLLIGTQILAKGHHFPHLGLVAIVDADGGLFSVDFRSVERMAQLIIQVAGRAGRVHEAGEVIIQTFHPEHPLLQPILHQDYAKLSQILLQERKASLLPPFSHLALIRAQGPKPELAQDLLSQVQATLAQVQKGEVSILGPVPAPMAKRQGQFRYQLLIQASERKALHQILSYSTVILENSKLAKKVRWSLDVDPIEMF